jgi:hypothetical protein
MRMMDRAQARRALISRITGQFPPSVLNLQAVLETLSMEGLRNLDTSLRLLGDRRGKDPRGDDYSAQRVVPLRAE